MFSFTIFGCLYNLSLRVCLVCNQCQHGSPNILSDVNDVEFVLEDLIVRYRHDTESESNIEK